MKQVAFERNSRKLAVKKPFNVPKLLSFEDRVEEEYTKEYNKQLEDYKKHHGEYPKGIYARWFDSDMWMMHQSIEAKMSKEEKQKKKEFLWER